MKHNIQTNFNAAGDDKMKRDIVMSEIAKKIYYDPKETIALLKSSGFTVPENVSQDALIKMVTSALNRSKRFATLMTESILQPEYKYSSEGDSLKERMIRRRRPRPQRPQRKPSSLKLGDKVGKVSSIINGIGSIFGGRKRRRAEAEAEKARAQAELTDKIAVIAGTPQTGNNMIYWIIGGLAAAGIGTTIWFVLRK